MMREVINIAGVDFNLHTSSIDNTTWHMLYAKGQRAPNHNLPAIIYDAVFPWELGSFRNGYLDMIYVNDLSYGKDDPILVCCWDFYAHDLRSQEWWGKYQHCYNDAQTAWYKEHGAWRGE